ncbi:MAG: hypothetical protein JWM80_830 [Cyanobacteria bacterium RYN_339]|nr:hypothetical protein [Cyanobacteria bacterium RYN_339]
MTTDFDTILSTYDPQVQALARAAHALVYDVLPQTVQVDWVRQKNVGLGTGPKKQTEHFAWIQPHKAHVNLGFNYGVELPDPEGLLEGTGALFRHVKLRSLDDLQRPALRALLEAATKHRVPPPAGRA